jgi:magnesium chelatase family protein
MLSKIYSAAVTGLDAQAVEVEIDLSQGLHCFSIVGLADKVVSESKERVSSAIKNSGFSPPQHSRKRVIVNLAPAELKKQGPAYDLPIALAFLFAVKEVEIKDIDKKLFIGELSLEGRVRKINGILPIALMAKKKGFKEIFVPAENAKEAALIKELTVFPVKSLFQLIAHLKKEETISEAPATRIGDFSFNSEETPNMSHIKGQEQAKRALEIAAAGAHNIIFHGPPGSGKTLLAKTLPSILPSLKKDEIFECTKIFSVSDCLSRERPLITKPPFRSPHHTSSIISLIGGGSNIKPGEVTLAHRGVLFLDEIPEYQRGFLESLRQPLEDNVITVARASGSVTFPAKFILISTMNPCPCGNLGDEHKECVCTPAQVSKYQRKISGPLLDRIDLHIEVPRVKTENLTSEKPEESSEKIKKRVMLARENQDKRFAKEKKVSLNSEMNLKQLKLYGSMEPEAAQTLKLATENLKLSARSYYRIIKIARSIADLESQEKIKPYHITEAVQYRPKEV